MKASEFVTMILNEITERGQDFDLAGAYWSEELVKEIYKTELKDNQETREDFFDILSVVMDQAAQKYLDTDLHYFTATPPKIQKERDSDEV